MATTILIGIFGLYMFAIVSSLCKENKQIKARLIALEGGIIRGKRLG